jgi:hypothetical protein
MTAVYTAHAATIENSALGKEPKKDLVKLASVGVPGPK